MSSFNEIKKISDETRKKIELLSVYSLPNNPSERGMTPEQIKKRFYEPILSSAASALNEIDRVVSEVNAVILQIDETTADARGTANDAKAASDSAAASAGEAANAAEAAKASAEESLLAAERAAEEAAESATDAEAAKNAILGLEVTTATAEPGALASAVASIKDGKILLHLTLPRGIQGVQGVRGERGEGFNIKRVYTSVEEMENGFATDGLSEGSFVLVRTENELEEDYGKVYVKGANGYLFEVDMSISIKGDKGDPGYTPQFGVDYWTEEHQSAIAAMIKNLVGSEVRKQLGVIENGSY